MKLYKAVKSYSIVLMITLLVVPLYARTGYSKEPRPETAPLVTNLPNFSPLIEKLTPVTVNISSTKTVKSGYNSQYGSTPFGEQNDPFRDFFGDDFYKHFFGGNPKREYKQKGLGSGFIIDSEGYILTNNHVIEDADEIKVKTHDETEYDAEVIGADPKTDLALLKIKGRNGALAAASLGDSDALKVGEWVIAIGNPFGLQETVTAGIVSAKWRKIGAGPYEDFIQTDASINPGNSGGPLFNLRGEVVGVNSMIYSPSGGNVGIGFAIPINLAASIVRQLKEKGRVIRGWLGVVVQTVTPDLAQSFGLEEGTGALIADVESGGPADDAGIKSGDIIVSFNGQPIKEMSELPIIVAETPVGQKTTVTILRNGKQKKVNVTIGELKESRESNTVAKQKTDMGMIVKEITPEMANAYGLSENSGIIIMGIEPGSPADEAGLRKGDIIKEINRNAVDSLDSYYKTLQKSGEENILLLVKRGRTSLWVVLKPKS